MSAKQVILYNNVLKGDYKYVKGLLDNDKNLSIEMVDYEGKTILMVACEKGHKEIVDYLLKKGAKVNIRSNSGYTALIYASCFGDSEIVKLLLDAGEDVNAQSNKGDNALLLSSERGYVDVVKILLEGGANVNVQNIYGGTALMYAVYFRNKEVVELLLENGGDMTIITENDKQEISLIEEAKIRNYTEIVDLFIKKMNYGNGSCEVTCEKELEKLTIKKIDEKKIVRFA